MAIIVFENIQVMQEDVAENIPLLLLAEEESEVDLMQLRKCYGIVSAFKVRVAVLSLQARLQNEDSQQLVTGVLEEELLENSSLRQEESVMPEEECCRLAFLLPVRLVISLLDKMKEEFGTVIPKKT